MYFLILKIILKKYMCTFSIKNEKFTTTNKNKLNFTY